MTASTRRRSTRWAAVAFPVAWMFLSSCGSAPPMYTGTPPPPVAAARVDTAGASGRPVLGAPPVPAITDSGPSAEALAVLRGIPEPLEGAGLPESTPTSGGSDTGQGQVPTPSPTAPLGQRPPASISPPASSVPSSPATGSGDPRTDSPPPERTEPARPVNEPPRRESPPGANEICWRIQVSASTSRYNAERARSIAESVLMVPMVVEQEGGYFKNRTRDCMDRDAADRLKARAVAGGYIGAFRFTGSRP